MGSDILVVLAAIPANRTVVSVLRARSTPRPADDPWARGGFELHTHPDLEERLDQAAFGQPGGGRSIGLYGVPALIAADVIYAVALGTSRIDLRIPVGPVRDAILQHGGSADSLFGPDWVGVDAWVGDLPLAEGTDLLRSWVGAAASRAITHA